MSPLKVKEVMSSPARTISPAKTIKDAARLMSKLRKGYLVVLRGKKVVGVISDSDVLKCVAKGKTRIKVEKAMSSPVVTVDASENVEHAVRKMQTNNIHRLPVMENGKLVGVVSLSDIARTVPDYSYLLEYRLRMKELAPQLKEEKTIGFCEGCGQYSDFLVRSGGDWLCERCREEREA